MLYMLKTRVTFRIDPRLAGALRELPNQTLFVETVLLEALGETCPACRGRGKVAARAMRVSDFKAARLPRLNRPTATRLREIVRLGRRLLATDVRLARAPSDALAFEIVRRDDVLLRGTVSRAATKLTV
jgi:hypothetical protein